MEGLDSCVTMPAGCSRVALRKPYSALSSGTWKLAIGDRQVLNLSSLSVVGTALVQAEQSEAELRNRLATASLHGSEKKLYGVALCGATGTRWTTLRSALA